MTSSQKITKTKHGSKGERTKNHIINSAITVLAKNGIKGTTHRAIAHEADIQLSLTTYYFKDIQTLIHQAFQLNSAKTIELASITWKDTFGILNTISATNLRKTAVKQKLCDDFSDIASRYIYNKIAHQTESLFVEQLLFTEINISPELRELAEQHKAALMAPFLKLSQYFNKVDPQVDADIMLTILTQLEYRHLTVPIQDVKIEDLHLVVKRIIAWVVGVKR